MKLDWSVSLPVFIFALYKRLPSTNEIDVENNIVTLTQWLMHAYDR